MVTKSISLETYLETYSILTDFSVGPFDLSRDSILEESPETLDLSPVAPDLPVLFRVDLSPWEDFVWSSFDMFEPIPILLALESE